MWQDIEVKTVLNVSEFGTEAFDASLVVDLIKSSAHNTPKPGSSKKKLNYSDSVASLLKGAKV